MAEGGVWSDPTRARQVVDEVKDLKRWIEPYNALRKRLDDAQALNDLAEAEHTDDLAQELEAEAQHIEAGSTRWISEHARAGRRRDAR
jgi:hypothetical protein